MESIGDLFGRYHLIKKGKPIDERSSLIGYFSKEIDRPSRLIGIRLAHYTIDQLYALQSAYKDRLERNGEVPARKYWWAITKTVAD